MSDGHHPTRSKPVLKLTCIAESVGIPILSIFLAGSVGAVILILSESHPMEAYRALFEGALGDLDAITRTLEKSTPLIYSGLAIALALRAGLFNIGAQGQLLFGALVAALAGYGIRGLPWVIHTSLALTAGALAGGIYAAIKGALKTYTGAHEVITGIMLNYVAINFTDYIAFGPFRDSSPGNILARTPRILDSAVVPHVGHIPLGFALAMAIAIGIWLFFQFTTTGFEIRTVGQNIHGARYAGIHIKRTVILTMVLSGMLAGLGGAVETQAVVYRFQPGFNVGLGFDGITVALLARVHPLAVIPASFLFGIMRAGTGQMQFDAGVSPEIIDVIQALILFFIAADTIIRRWIGLSREDRESMSLTSGWGKMT